MNLSKPWSVVPLNGTVMSSVQQAAPYRLPNPPPCSPGYTYALINESTVTGDYPVSLAYLNDSSAVDEFNTAFLGIAGTFSVAFNSNTLPPTTSVNQSTRVQMSSIPSATSNNDTIDYNPGAGAGAYNPYVMAEIYIPNVTMHVTNYQVYYTYLGPGDQCETQNLGVQTTIKVASVGAFSNEQNPFYAKINNQTSMGWFIQRAFGLHQLQQVTLPAGAALSNTTVILDNATGWSSAASEEQTVVNGFSVFTALLGMAFTIMDAASAFEGASTAADVASGIEITNAALGLAAACAAAFSSISFSSTYHLAITSMILTNVLTDQGNGFTVTFYQAEQNSTITLAGSTHNVNMPQTYYYVTA